MLILAFDTTSEKGGVGVFRDAECLAFVSHEGSANQYSVSLFEMVERVLALSHLELRQIDVYGAANGPGSFTGIRIGLAAARAWGRAFDRPVRGVSVLQAMVNKRELDTRGSRLVTRGARLAEPPVCRPGWLEGEQAPASQESCGPDWYFPILDARRSEFYLGNFRRIPSGSASVTGQDYEHADAGWLLKPEALAALLEERLKSGERGICLVRAHDHPAAELRACLPGSLEWQAIEGTLVDSIADIAWKREQSNRPCLPAELDAYYIRRPDAETHLDSAPRR